MKNFARLCALLALSLALLPFGPAFAQTPGVKPLKVVASFSVLGDMVWNIGGDAIELSVLAGPDADMHTYQPAPADVKALAEADVIAINGLGLDHWMQPLIEASNTRAKLLVASAGIKPLFSDEGDKAVPDPHAWQDLGNARVYARNIAGALIGSAPEHGAVFRENLAKYDDEIKKTDAYVRGQLKNISPGKRKIITSHDAFGYFGKAYDVTFLAAQGLSTESEPSAKAVAQLIDQIKEEKVSAVFVENIKDPRLMQQIAKESRAKIGGTLYADALSDPKGPAPTYLDMFRHNVKLMKEAMEQNNR